MYVLVILDNIYNYVIISRLAIVWAYVASAMGWRKSVTSMPCDLNSGAS